MKGFYILLFSSFTFLGIVIWIGIILILVILFNKRIIDNIFEIIRAYKFKSVCSLDLIKALEHIQKNEIKLNNELSDLQKKLVNTSNLTSYEISTLKGTLRDKQSKFNQAKSNSVFIFEGTVIDIIVKDGYFFVLLQLDDLLISGKNHNVIIQYTPFSSKGISFIPLTAYRNPYHWETMASHKVSVKIYNIKKNQACTLYGIIQGYKITQEGSQKPTVEIFTKGSKYDFI